MNKKICVLLALVFVAGFVAASLFGGHSEYYSKYESLKYGFFPYYSTIDKRCSEKDRERAQDIINLAGQLMTDTDGDVPQNVGKLDIYSLKKAEVVRSEVKINLITADFTFSGGYIWSEYHQKLFGEDEVIKEQKNRLAYWKLKKQKGEWIVVKVREVEI